MASENCFIFRTLFGQMCTLNVMYEALALHYHIRK